MYSAGGAEAAAAMARGRGERKGCHRAGKENGLHGMVSVIDAVLIAGPTAGGKSAAALALAERLGGAVINTDSMQVYRELRVLSARPGPDEAARAPHLLYGHVPAAERYSAGRYLDDAAQAMAESHSAGRVPIFVGGTGLYFEALDKGLAPIPPVPMSVREANRALLAELGPEAFFAEFAARDRETASRLRPGDTQRVLRAADVFAATGRPLARWQETKGASLLEAMRVARFVLAPPREALYGAHRCAVRRHAGGGRARRGAGAGGPRPNRCPRRGRWACASFCGT